MASSNNKSMSSSSSPPSPQNMPQLTSTTAPGKIFSSRAELAEHYKSDYHKYNLKRREAGLVLLEESDFQARLDAALALRKEQQGREERTGTDHLKKNKKDRKKKKKARDQADGGAVTTKSQAAAYDRIKQQQEEEDGEQVEEHVEADAMETEETPTPTTQQVQPEEEESPVIEPRQCLFDKHMSPTIDANLERMQRKYGFFVPDQEYLMDKEGLLGYCHEKIKLGHYCLYCQRIFSTWQGCQKHMISTRHTKLRYERGIDMEEFDPFYDFSEADAEFMASMSEKKKAAAGGEEQDEDEEMVVVDDEENQDDEDWEDVTDDEEMEDRFDEAEPDEEEDGDNLYAGYKDEIAKYGFDVTPLGELILPDGRIVGHRGLARYYKQRVAPHRERAAVVAAREAAGERLYHGRVYNITGGASQQHEQHGGPKGESTTLTLARAGISPGTAAGRAGSGVLVPTGSGGFTALSLYRYRAVVKKARRDDVRGQRLENKTKQNINRMDKKANRLMNGVSVAHAQR